MHSQSISKTPINIFDFGHFWNQVVKVTTLDGSTYVGKLRYFYSADDNDMPDDNIELINENQGWTLGRGKYLMQSDILSIELNK